VSKEVESSFALTEKEGILTREMLEGKRGRALFGRGKKKEERANEIASIGRGEGEEAVPASTESKTIRASSSKGRRENYIISAGRGGKGPRVRREKRRKGPFLANSSIEGEGERIRQKDGGPGRINKSSSDLAGKRAVLTISTCVRERRDSTQKKQGQSRGTEFPQELPGTTSLLKGGIKRKGSGGKKPGRKRLKA